MGWVRVSLKVSNDLLLSDQSCHRMTVYMPLDAGASRENVAHETSIYSYIHPHIHHIQLEVMLVSTHSVSGITMSIAYYQESNVEHITFVCIGNNVRICARHLLSTYILSWVTMLQACICFFCCDNVSVNEHTLCSVKCNRIGLETCSVGRHSYRVVACFPITSYSFKAIKKNLYKPHV